MSVFLDIFKAVQTFALSYMRHVTGLMTRKVEGSGWSTAEDSIFLRLREPEPSVLLQDCTQVQIPQFIRIYSVLVRSLDQCSINRSSGSPVITLSHTFIYSTNI